MVDTKNDEIVSKYFDIVQEKIKKLISDDKEIRPDQVEEFNDLIFNQEEEIQNQIRYYIDKATMNNLNLDKVAKIIYDKFKVQTKNNYFNTKDSQPVPNPMVGERKYIKNFEQFNESSYFHSIDNIDEILDKITNYGYENLDPSDLAILNNYARDDKDIRDLILKMSNLTIKFLKLNQKLSVLSKKDKKELEKVKIEWNNLHLQMSEYEDLLINLYKVNDPDIIKGYIENKMTNEEI